MKYLINPNGYFFAIEDDVAPPLDTDKLVAAGCRFFILKEEMYAAVMIDTDQDLDEIEGGEMVISTQNGGDPVCIDARGTIDYIADSVEYQRGGIEEYLIDYVL